ncbi:MAG: hypothetical protein PHV82_03370 [Victivallaceae bacterium]|nr:hypothetical protein [Victivallaceae bacterium]
MRIPNDKIVQQAIQNAVNKLGSQDELAKKTGVLQKDISRYISGKGKSFTPQAWGNLYKYIREFLPENYTENFMPDNDNDRSINLIGYNHETIVVHSIAGLTTAKEIKSDLIKNIIDSGEFDQETKLKIIALISKDCSN